MKTVASILLAIVATSLVTGYFTRFYYENKISNSTEDVVSREVALLEKAASIHPPCDKLSGSVNNTAVENVNGFIVIWRVAKESKFIHKFVIDSDFHSAYEKVKNNCGHGKDNNR